jgi:hypothetical protein
MGNIYIIIASYPSAFYNTGEDSFLWHNAIPCLIVNSAFIVAFLANLRDFYKRSLSKFNKCSDGYSFPVNSGCRNILCKVAKRDIQPLVT